MRSFRFYIMLDKNGKLSKAASDRLRKYLDVAKTYKLTFVWICENISFNSVCSLIEFEKKECAQTGWVLENVLYANNSRIGLFTKKIMEAYSFQYGKKNSDVYQNDIEGMSWGNQPVSCCFNSCLGNTLTIFNDGTIGICPFFANSVVLNEKMEIEDLLEVFDTESFSDLIKEHIGRRNNCKSNCEYYKLCKGGCALKTDAGSCTIMGEIKKATTESKGVDDRVLEHLAENIASKYKV